MLVFEIILVAVGIVLIFASFYVTESLSKKDLEEIGRISESEIKILVEKRMAEAENTIIGTVDSVVNTALDRSERFMEKESNEKIMAISEYSDTVIRDINKTHTEVMFLYDMLNNQKKEISKATTDLSGIALRTESLNQEIEEKTENWSKKQDELDRIISNNNEDHEITASASNDNKKVVMESMDNDMAESIIEDNHNEDILRLYNEGRSDVEIARELSLGIGVVRLVIELYKGDKGSEA